MTDAIATKPDPRPATAPVAGANRDAVLTGLLSLLALQQPEIAERVRHAVDYGLDVETAAYIALGMWVYSFARKGYKEIAMRFPFLRALLPIALVAGLGCAWSVGNACYAMGQGASCRTYDESSGQVVSEANGAALSEGAVASIMGVVRAGVSLLPGSSTTVESVKVPDSIEVRVVDERPE